MSVKTESTNIIILTLTAAQVSQLLTAVQVRSLQADSLIRADGFCQCSPENQANLRAQSQIADQVLLLVERAVR
jgi:hypothetical protein